MTSQLNYLLTVRDADAAVVAAQVEEVRQYKEELMNERRELMSNKLAMAEEKRQLMLRNKVRKAHEEETKVRTRTSTSTSDMC